MLQETSLYNTDANQWYKACRNIIYKFYDKILMNILYKIMSRL